MATFCNGLKLLGLDIFSAINLKCKLGDYRYASKFWPVLGSWGKTMRDAVRNKERWKTRRTPTQDPSTDVHPRRPQGRGAAPRAAARARARGGQGGGRAVWASPGH